MRPEQSLVVEHDESMLDSVVDKLVVTVDLTVVEPTVVETEVELTPSSMTQIPDTWHAKPRSQSLVFEQPSLEGSGMSTGTQTEPTQVEADGNPIQSLLSKQPIVHTKEPPILTSSKLQ